ncbi:acyl carrier protein [Candidatus Magnetomonas plexicatena]|uniref:acyl carrier protein n=1 Tax=Candidatus Magnetomonas plexicatena TaxID=2552947 RepID=UPI0011048686|nr:acyl carrier protein [Nitrospirales bacterium LBB_01]
MTTIEQLQPIFKDVFDNESVVVTRQSSADDIDEWDSLNHVNLIIAIQEHFGIEFSLGDLDSLNNVGEMADLIEKLVKEKHG